jgi:membrane-bound lytic murein transglycosylase D
MEGQGGITTLTKNETKSYMIAQNDNPMLSKEELTNTKTQFVSGRYNSMVITKYISMDVLAFNRMNPDFDKLIANNGKYELRLPNEKMEVFLAKKSEILSESMQILLNSVSDSKNIPGKTNR